MTSSPDTDGVVLIVEDEPDLADTYALWLDQSYTVRTAYNGESALDQLNESVDVVLLDRRMPDLSGDDVLASIRDRGLDCRVAMVTAVEPNVDIVEMPFDVYLHKPVEKTELENLVEQLLAQNQYDDRLQEFYSLVNKKAALDAEMNEQRRANSELYAELDGRLTEVRQQTDAALEEVFTQTGFTDVLISIMDDSEDAENNGDL